MAKMVQQQGAESFNQDWTAWTSSRSAGSQGRCPEPRSCREGVAEQRGLTLRCQQWPLCCLGPLETSEVPPLSRSPPQPFQTLPSPHSSR